VSAVNDLLLIDIGNSFIKYSFADSSKPGVITAIDYLDDMSGVKALLTGIKQVRVSAVGQRKKFTQLQQELSGLDVIIAETKGQAFGIQFAYKQMHTLGVDRWLAMIAAHQSYSGDLAVVSLGTAATCDLINAEGLHLGGWIAPGYNSLRQTLLDNTAQVFSDGKSPAEVNLGQNTSDCVNYGCLAMLEGFLSGARQQLAKLGQENKLIVTGGDRDLLSGFKNNHTFWEENLVLKGLSYL